MNVIGNWMTHVEIQDSMSSQADLLSMSNITWYTLTR